MPARTAEELPRLLGLLDSTVVVIGTMIGVGVFLVPASIARQVPSPPLILALWLIGGLISLCGALAYAELGAMMPNSGGPYVYLREAYGPLVAFLCGWTYFLVVNSGAIATVSVGFSIYLSYLLPTVPGVTRWAPILLILTLTYVNYRGVRAGARTQLIFTVLKLSGLALVISCAFITPNPRPFDWSIPSSGISAMTIGAALMGCFVAYDGWHNVAFIAGEVRNPQRILPRALAIGVIAVMGVYLAANIAYLRVLPLDVIAATERVAAHAAAQVLGPLGATLVTLTIVLSSAGAGNGALMTSARVYYAQARDGLFFRSMAEVHARYRTPAVAILIQGIWTALLTITGSYETLFTYTLYASWLVHAMAVLALLVLRKKRPHAERPYRMWGYPLAPLLFVAFALWFVINTFVTRPGSSLVGTLIVASGVPAYFFWRRKATMGA